MQENVYMREGENVESPDVLEMVMDFLASLLPALPTRKRIFIYCNESEGCHCLLPLQTFHMSNINGWWVLQLLV